MKLVIVSDNHGDSDILQTIASHFADSEATLIHCGDSELAPDSPAMKPWQAVAGNNDFGLDYPPTRLLKLGAERILVVHGHHDGVSRDLTRLGLHAAAEKATVACYGHTHHLAVTVDRGSLFINPGSISLPRGTYCQLGGTFAVVDVTKDHFGVQYYTRELQPVPELKFTFSRN